MNTFTISDSLLSSQISTFNLLGLPTDTNLAQLGHQHGLNGLDAQYPQYLEYYQAWSDSYRQFLLSSQNKNSSSPF
jgi:hypothetical protein